MIADTCEEMVETYRDQKNYKEFTYELMRIFAHTTEISEDDFMGKKHEQVVDLLFAELMTHYTKKVEDLGQFAFPVIKNVYETQGVQYENISVPITDGLHQMNIPVHLKKAYDSQGKEISKTFEKFSSLYIIDNEWKEHLREMDELKQSSQNAVFEQKDPLLIYKLESFKLFNTMLSTINKSVLGMLYKGFIPIENPSDVKKAEEPKKQDLSKLKTSRTDDLAEATKNNQQAAQAGNEAPKVQQVKGVVKIGRNDPCPCGSGKKYKSCHGKDEIN
jgi:preprotein translocase subunit SecA